MQTFVEDLLDLGLMRANAFSLTNSIFDVNEIFKLVLDVF